MNKEKQNKTKLTKTMNKKEAKLTKKKQYNQTKGEKVNKKVICVKVYSSLYTCLFVAVDIFTKKEIQLKRRKKTKKRKINTKERKLTK